MNIAKEYLQNKTSAVFPFQSIPYLVIQYRTLEIISHHLIKSFPYPSTSLQFPVSLLELCGWRAMSSKQRHIDINFYNPPSCLRWPVLATLRTPVTWQHLPHLSEGGALRAGAGWSFPLSLPLSLSLHLRSGLWHSNPHKVDDVMEVRQQAGAWKPAVMAVLLDTGLL